ncbi:MAG: ABC transporter permease [Halobacteriaceae archaeon]
MRSLALLVKELRWSRHELVPLLVVLLLLPAVFAYGTLAFETVLPTDAPVAVVPQGPAVTDDDVAITRGAVTAFSDPRTYDSRRAAFDALSRERVYAVVTVPPDITDTSTRAVFEVYVDGSVVPYHEASKAVVGVMNVYLSRLSDAPIGVERHVVGTERSLSEYLVPTFALVVAMLVALVYLPHVLVVEAETVFDRLRVDASLSAAVGAKLAFFSALALVPVAVFAAFAAAFHYGVDLATPGVVVAYLSTFVALASVATAVTFLTGFSTWGRVVNVVLLFFVGGFSGLLYPAGFFSPVRRRVVRAVPTHYAIVAMRGYALRDAPPSFFGTWLVGLVGLAVASVLGLRVVIAVYERRC